MITEACTRDRIKGAPRGLFREPPSDARMAQSTNSGAAGSRGFKAASPRPIAQSTGARLVGPTRARTDTSTDPSDTYFFGCVVHFRMEGYVVSNSALPWKNGIP